MNKSRRQFLLRSFAVAGVAATGRMFWINSEEFVPDILTVGDSWEFLDPEDRLILAMITPVLLDGVVTGSLSGIKLVRFLRDFDHSLTLLTQSQQDEFRQLLSLLKSQLGRLVMAGIWNSWNNVSAATIDQMLNNWRNSYLDLIKIAYRGLKELTFATWYGNPENWKGIGYAGPPEVYR